MIKPLWLGVGLLCAFLSGLFIGLDYQKKTHLAELAEQQSAYIDELNARQKEIMETELAWLNEDRQIETVYRDKTKTVIKTVKQYVEVNNLDHCQLDDDRLRLVNQALRGPTIPQ